MFVIFVGIRMLILFISSSLRRLFFCLETMDTRSSRVSSNIRPQFGSQWDGINRRCFRWRDQPLATAVTARLLVLPWSLTVSLHGKVQGYYGIWKWNFVSYRLPLVTNNISVSGMAMCNSDRNLKTVRCGSNLAILGQKIRGILYSLLWVKKTPLRFFT